MFPSQSFAFSEDKIGYFQSLDFYHKPIDDNSNFRSFSMRPQKLKNNLTYPSASGCADPKIAPKLPSRPVDLFWQSMKIVNNIFLKKLLSEMAKNGKAIFYSRPRMKVESTIENARNTSNTGSKSYV